MTAQIPDSLFYGTEEYYISIQSSALFDPMSLGFEPTMMHTACYEGYWCKFAVDEDQLYLMTLAINDVNDFSPNINGKDKCKIYTLSESERGYSDLWMPLGYSGKFIASCDFIQDKYVHMGFQHPSSFETNIEMTFEDGKLAAVDDISEAIQQFSWHEDTSDMDRLDEIAISFIRSYCKL